MTSLNQGPVSQLSGTTLVSTKSPLTPSAPTFATVGTSSALAVASNASRKGLILINDSVNKIYLALGINTAVIGSGIVIYPNGGVYDMSEFDYVQSAVNAIAGSAGSNLTIQEFT